MRQSGQQDRRRAAERLTRRGRAPRFACRRASIGPDRVFGRPPTWWMPGIRLDSFAGPSAGAHFRAAAMTRRSPSSSSGGPWSSYIAAARAAVGHSRPPHPCGHGRSSAHGRRTNIRSSHPGISVERGIDSPENPDRGPPPPGIGGRVEAREKRISLTRHLTMIARRRVRRTASTKELDEVLRESRHANAADCALDVVCDAHELRALPDRSRRT